MRSERLIRIGLRVVLVLSLLLNAVALGIVWRILDFRDEYGLRDTLLPRAERVLVREALFADEETLRPALLALGDARRRFVTAATTDPYDPDEARAALDDVAASGAALQALAQHVMLEALAAR